MNAFSIILLLLSVLLINAQFQPRTSNRGTIFRPMTRNSVGRRGGPVAPAPFRNNVQKPGTRPPGFKPPSGVAKKLNSAVDFRALARVLLKQ